MEKQTGFRGKGKEQKTGSDRNLAPDPDGSLLLSAAWCLSVPDSSGGAIVRGQRRWGICH